MYNSISKDGNMGGICLDFYDKIPKPYDTLLHIGKNVMIKSNTYYVERDFILRE